MSYSHYTPEVRKPDWVKELEVAWPGSAWKQHQYSPETWEFTGRGFVANANCGRGDTQAKVIRLSVLGPRMHHGKGSDAQIAVEDLKRNLRGELSAVRAARAVVADLEGKLGDALAAARASACSFQTPPHDQGPQ